MYVDYPVGCYVYSSLKCTVPSKVYYTHPSFHGALHPKGAELAGNSKLLFLLIKKK